MKTLADFSEPKLAKIPHGAQCIVSARYIRIHAGVRTITCKYMIQDFAKTPGIFLGLRTLSNGYTEDFEGYQPTHYFKAALVSTSKKANPFYVPLEYITVVED